MFSQPRESSDWLGLGYVIQFGFVMLAASVIAVVFALRSFSRSEPKAGLSLLVAAPGTLFLLAVLAWVASNVHRNYEKQKQEAFVSWFEITSDAASTSKPARRNNSGAYG